MSPIVFERNQSKYSLLGFPLALSIGLLRVGRRPLPTGDCIPLEFARMGDEHWRATIQLGEGNYLLLGVRRVGGRGALLSTTIASLRVARLRLLI